MSSPALIPQRLLQTPFVDANTGILTPIAANLMSRILAPAKIPQLVINTHANRDNVLASKYPNGSLYYESDRTVFYIAENGAWIYAFGVMQSAQADIPTDLGANDANLLLNVTDYAHLLQWTGTGWQWGPAENGSGYTVPFVNPPSLTGWQAADGSQNVATLNGDSTLSFVTVPNTAGSFYRQ